MGKWAFNNFEALLGNSCSDNLLNKYKFEYLISYDKSSMLTEVE
jgi:hypothetical protein